LREDFLVFGKAAGGLLGKEQAPVGDDVENAPGALDELGFIAGGLLDGGGQTGRLGMVISTRAVGDRNRHAGAPRRAHARIADECGPAPPLLARPACVRPPLA